MATNAIDGVRTTDPSALKRSAGKTELGKDDFLKLLTTQMQYQDPLNPMDNAAFTAQLAQFSSLEQLFQVNGQLGGLVESQTPSGMASVAGFIDREILAEGNRVQVGENGASPIQFSLDSPAQIANVLIFGADEREIRSIPLGQTPGGENQIVWDGLDNNGNTVADGDYRFDVVAQDEFGSTVAARTQVRGRVNGAIYEDGGAYLLVGTHRIALQDVLAVREATAAAGQ
jgi:flagellar basal-body rod modification protein FlgD